MREHHALKLTGRHSLLDGNTCTADNLATRITQHVYANYTPRGLVGNDLAHTFATFVLGHETPRVGHRKFLTNILNATLLCLLFGETYASYLRIGIHDTRDSIVVHRVIVATQVIDDNLGFTAGSVSQERETGNITSCIYAINICTHTIIDLDRTALKLYSQIFQA